MHDSLYQFHIKLAGGNFGWADVEGDLPPGQPGYVYPIHSYSHVSGSYAVIAGDHAEQGDFSPEYEGDYFYADFGTKEIFRVRQICLRPAEN